MSSLSICYSPSTAVPPHTLRTVPAFLHTPHLDLQIIENNDWIYLLNILMKILNWKYLPFLQTLPQSVSTWPCRQTPTGLTCLHSSLCPGRPDTQRTREAIMKATNRTDRRDIFWLRDFWLILTVVLTVCTQTVFWWNIGKSLLL